MKILWQVFKLCSYNPETDSYIVDEEIHPDRELPNKVKGGWNIGTSARIDLGNWEKIVEFAKEINSNVGSMLEKYSSFDPDKQSISQTEILHMDEFLKQVASLIENMSEPFIKPSDIIKYDSNLHTPQLIVENFDNKTNADMCRAICAVLDEAILHRGVFYSYAEG